jgi:hypothetical protein
MPALPQSALVSGWLGASAASTVGATAKAIPNAKIEFIAFISSVRKVISLNPDRTHLWLTTN